MKQNLKISIALIITMLIGFHSKAQTIPVAGAHYPNTTMSAFHGTWRWTSGTDTIKIFFTTASVFYNINGGFTSDDLVGWYYYKKGNNVIFSNYSSIPNSSIESTISGSNRNESINKISAYFKDPLKEKTISLSLILNASQNQITWSAYSIGLGYANRPAPLPGMTLPSNIVLNRL